MVLGPILFNFFKKARILMKINGHEIQGACVSTLVLPRGEDNIIIKAQSIPDFDEFDKLCPEPKAPGILTKAGWEPNLKDESYRSVLNIYQENRIAYLIVRSLEVSDIEWDSVDVNNPKTWTNYIADFKEAGLSEIEIGHIVQLVMEANSLDEKKLEEARKNFLLGQRMEVEESFGPETGQQSLPSGKPAAE